MDTKKLEQILNDEWLKVDTWYTMHPADEQRFHKAIQKSYKSFKRYISEEQFIKAISNTVVSTNRNEEIEKFAKKADCILSYLSDINNM